ncbi:Com family DNA-binding transcriptional regulator [Methylocaldum sp. MU1018]
MARPFCCHRQNGARWSWRALIEIRCGGCGRKVAEGAFSFLRFKWPRCKIMNYLRTGSSQPERPERLTGDAHDPPPHRSAPC